MHSRKAKIELRTFATARGLVFPPQTPGDAFTAMLAFFRDVRAENCQEDDHDMLLFQWGTYDWGRGRHFEFDITRQFISDRSTDGDDIWQLHATFRFPPTAELDALGRGNRWCHSLAALPEFESFVLGSPVFAVVAKRTDGVFEMLYESAE